MNNKREKACSRGAVLVASALAALLASSALAQGQPETASAQGRDSQFQRLDQNADDLLVWQELDAGLGPHLMALGMDEQLIMTIFDEDGDSALDPGEFGRFQQGVRQADEQLRNRRLNAEAQQRGASSSAEEGSSSGEHRGRRTLGGGNVKLSSEELEKAIIERSFDRDVRSDKVSKVQAGSSVFSEAEEPVKVKATAKTATGAQQDGTAVIVVDGQVIASTAVANPEPAARDQAEDADDRPSAAARETQQSESKAGSTATLEKNDPRSIYAGLKNTPVVNTNGESVGVIEGLVVNSETGKAGLVVNTGGVTSIGGAKVLAPLTSVAVTADSVVWQTPQTREELTQSNPYQPAGHIEIAPSS